MDLLENDSTKCATALLPSSGFAEKRGSMINGDGRLQRLNRAVRAPGQARDDWEILRDLIQAHSGRNGIYTIEEVFAQMSQSVPQFAGLSLSKIGDLGVQVIDVNRDARPAELTIRIRRRSKSRESRRRPPKANDGLRFHRDHRS